MNIVPYLKYFLFITKHWNPRLALFTVRHEISGEKKYGINTIEVDNLKRLSVKGQNKKEASIYQGTNYFILEKAFDYLAEMKVNQNDAVVDFGAGKGRIMAVAAYRGFRHIKGIEFAPALCEAARQNLKGVLEKHPEANTDVLCLDAVDYEVQKEDSVFFFFNPFNERVMLSVVKNMLRSVKGSPRDITVVYINPLFKEIFESAGFIEEYYFVKLDYLELSILRYYGH